MRKNQFVKHLEKLDQEDLREELMQLFNKIPAVRDHYKMEFGGTEVRKKMYDAAKQNIASKYKTKSFRKPRRPRIQKIRQILNDLEKKAIFNYELIDVYLFDVETALSFARNYDYFTQVLFNNISKSFGRAAELIEHNMMQDDYKERCTEILQLSRYIIELYDHLKLEYNKTFDDAS